MSDGMLPIWQALTGSTSTDAGILSQDAAARVKAAISSVSTAGLVTMTGGYKVPVISGSGATVALTAAQSGSICLFDRAAGIAYTLPAPSVGLCFTFITTVTRTSNAESIATDVAGTKLLGNVLNTIDTGTSNIACFGNGTSHVTLSMNGTTTGGILGSQLLFTCVSATIWNVTGIINGSGSIATPFA